jgi:hypothetical protein
METQRQSLFLLSVFQRLSGGTGFRCGKADLPFSSAVGEWQRVRFLSVIVLRNISLWTSQSITRDPQQGTVM